VWLNLTQPNLPTRMKHPMKSEMNRNDVYEYVTQRMIERLDKGEVPW